MKHQPHIRLAIAVPAASEPTALQRTVDSVRHLIDSALVVIAPKAYACLPADGFGYCSLETRVLQAPHIAELTRTDLVRLADGDTWVDWVLTIDAGDTVPTDVRVADLPLDADVDHWTIAGAHLVRARSGFRFDSPQS